MPRKPRRGFIKSRLYAERLELFASVFTYDHVSGQLIWKNRPRDHFDSNMAFGTWNAKYPGKIAGSPDAKGHILVSINNELLKAHRVIFEMFKGEIPCGMVIDHIDGVPGNNRLDNLRIATVAQNTRNSKAYRTNKAGAKGVVKSGSSFRAKIFVDGITHGLGTFLTLEEAAAAYQKAATEFHGEFSRSRSLKGAAENAVGRSSTPPHVSRPHGETGEPLITTAPPVAGGA